MEVSKIAFNQEVKSKLQEGVNKLNDAVSVSLGPFGRNVLYKNEYGEIRSTKDGVSIAKMIQQLEDPIEDFGAQIIKQASIKTVEQAGDGTTTATVLAHSMATQALELRQANINLTQVKWGMEEAVKHIIDQLKTYSSDISDENQIQQIATLSANGDQEIGILVSEAMNKVGREGVVTVEESRTGETSLEVVEGLQFERGYRTPYFSTDNNSMTCILKDVSILIYDRRIGPVKDLLPLLEDISAKNKSLLIIAEDIEGEALGTLIMNKNRGVLQVCAVKAPDYGDRRLHLLEDIAAITGGTVVSHDKGMTLAKFDTNWLGKARMVTVTKDTTTIVDGEGDSDKIAERIMSIKNQMDNSKSPFEIENLQSRLAKMVGGIAIINIGGSNEIEMKEKKDRLEDALQATKSALEEGILPGAGVALFHARKCLAYDKTNSDDFNRGKKIVYEACSKPLETILTNAGEDKFPYLVELEKNNKKINLVPKIGSLKLVDSSEHGIIDPTKVVRVALLNALGAATTLLLTQCVIYSEKNEKKSENPVNFM